MNAAATTVATTTPSGTRRRRRIKRPRISITDYHKRIITLGILHRMAEPKRGERTAHPNLALVRVRLRGPLPAACRAIAYGRSLHLSPHAGRGRASGAS